MRKNNLLPNYFHQTDFAQGVEGDYSYIEKSEDDGGWEDIGTDYSDDGDEPSQGIRVAKCLICALFAFFLGAFP